MSDGPVGRGTVLALTVSAAEEMRELGRRLASVLTAGDLVILTGGLGAGKTTLTQGIGDGLRVRGPITSPTFVIARVHPPLAASAAGGNGAAGPGPALVHADAYRLGSVLELDDLDLDTDTASSVTVVEWGEGLAEGLSADRLEITIAPVAAAGDAMPEAEPAVVAGDAAGAGRDGDADAEDEGAAADRPRTVLISAVGQRWEGVELPLLGLADRL
jgi:tRNA threonylcarbamoyladenosine biosynthesis protein TsaE